MLGILNYYRKFIEGFSAIVQPLTALIRKDIIFAWGIEYKEVLKELKRRMTIALILVLFDLEKEVTLEIDSLDYVIEVYLTQKGEDGRLRLIAYFSRKITALELNYNIHDKELLAVVEAFKEWRIYLEGTIYLV